MEETCEHLETLATGRRPPVHPHAHGCEDCLAIGSRWVHLRLCLSCGHVGCCDDSPNRHARMHARHVAHPVVKSFEPGEDWAYCFADDAMIDAIPATPEESPPVHFG